jgi:hypothetical protein
MHRAQESRSIQMTHPIASKKRIADEIRALAKLFANDLSSKISGRVTEMEDDTNSHYLIYQVLGISEEEGRLIDVYQNKGRFLYKYAGSFLERAAKLCFLERFPDSGSVRIPNSVSQKPKTFEIDCLVNGKDAFEIKWRDATTDGDHITKEHSRLKAVASAGYKPIRIMFYYPNRSQAVRIQQTLETLYQGVQGEYHYGDAAWEFVRTYTGVDLKGILENIAEESNHAATQD